MWKKRKKTKRVRVWPFLKNISFLKPPPSPQTSPHVIVVPVFSLAPFHSLYDAKTFFGATYWQRSSKQIVRSGVLPITLIEYQLNEISNEPFSEMNEKIFNRGISTKHAKSLRYQSALVIPWLNLHFHRRASPLPRIFYNNFIASSNGFCCCIVVLIARSPFWKSSNSPVNSKQEESKTMKDTLVGKTKIEPKIWNCY